MLGHVSEDRGHLRVERLQVDRENRGVGTHIEACFEQERLEGDDHVAHHQRVRPDMRILEAVVVLVLLVVDGVLRLVGVVIFGSLLQTSHGDVLGRLEPGDPCCVGRLEYGQQRLLEVQAVGDEHIRTEHALGVAGRGFVAVRVGTAGHDHADLAAITHELTHDRAQDLGGDHHTAAPLLGHGRDRSGDGQRHDQRGRPQHAGEVAAHAGFVVVEAGHARAPDVVFGLIDTAYQ